MTLLDLQKKRHEQLDTILKDVSPHRLWRLLTEIEKNKSQNIQINIHVNPNDPLTFTFFETDVDYITTLLSTRRGEEYFKVSEEESQKRFVNISTSELQQVLDMLTVEQWGRVESIGDTVINLGGSDIPAIQKELERRKTIES